MDEPREVLRDGTRVRIHAQIRVMTGGLIHESYRKAGATGVITGIVAGHGGDVYWVAHVGNRRVAAYGWDEFELEPPVNCTDCAGSGISLEQSQINQIWTACPSCRGGLLTYLERLVEPDSIGV